MQNSFITLASKERDDCLLSPATLSHFLDISKRQVLLFFEANFLCCLLLPVSHLSLGHFVELQGHIQYILQANICESHYKEAAAA